MNANKTTLTLALTAAMGASLGVAGIAHAANSFAMQPLAQGYMVAAADKAMEGKCGGNAKTEDGKCGAGKTTKAKDGKCGEGKCGANKAKSQAKAADGKCGGNKAKDGNCGANKAAEGKCGGNKM